MAEETHAFHRDDEPASVGDTPQRMAVLTSYASVRYVQM